MGLCCRYLSSDFPKAGNAFPICDEVSFVTHKKLRLPLLLLSVSFSSKLFFKKLGLTLWLACRSVTYCVCVRACLRACRRVCVCVSIVEALSVSRLAQHRAEQRQFSVSGQPVGVSAMYATRFLWEQQSSPAQKHSLTSHK